MTPLWINRCCFHDIKNTYYAIFSWVLLLNKKTSINFADWPGDAVMQSTPDPCESWRSEVPIFCVDKELQIEAGGFFWKISIGETEGTKTHPRRGVSGNFFLGWNPNKLLLKQFSRMMVDQTGGHQNYLESWYLWCDQQKTTGQWEIIEW